MRTLVNTLNKFFEKKDLEGKTDNLNKLEVKLRGDEDNRLASLLVQMMDSPEPMSDEDFVTFHASLEEYQVNKELGTDSALSYEYEPPKEILEEFGINKESSGIMVITKNGQRIQINNLLQEVGPVDVQDQPVEGHPDYKPPEYTTNVTPLFPGAREEAVSFGEIPDGFEALIAQNRSGDIEAESVLAKAAAYDQRLGDTELHQGIRKPGGLISRPLHYGALNISPRPQPKLKTVIATLEDIGAIEYEVLQAIVSGRFVVLVFDTRYSKPPFFPALGLKFELDVEGSEAIHKVLYHGICFSYDKLKFMCFSKID